MNLVPDPVPEAGNRRAIRCGVFQAIIILLLLAQVAIAAAVQHGVFWVVVPLVFVTAHLMHGALIGFHEASHGLLRRSRKLNEFDGTIIGVFSFLPFTLFRAVHQSHHIHLTNERDEEFWPLTDPGKPRWVRRLAAGLELGAGLFYSPLIFYRAFFRSGSSIRSAKVRRRIWLELMLTLGVWTCIISMVATWDLWQYLFWIYLAPAWLAANLQSWRKYVEHVGLGGSTVNAVTRNVVSKSWFGRVLSFSLLHEPYHGVHHKFVGVPHRELPKFERVLQPAVTGELPPFPNYRQAILHMIRSLGNPHVGAQWVQKKGRTPKPCVVQPSPDPSPR